MPKRVVYNGVEMMQCEHDGDEQRDGDGW